MFLNGACLHLGDTFFLATPSPGLRLHLGDAFFLGDAFTWATPSFLSTPCPRRRLFLGDASHYFKRRKIKAENQDTSFSQTGLTFYLGDLIKKPPRGKKSVPFN